MLAFDPSFSLTKSCLRLPRGRKILHPLFLVPMYSAFVQLVVGVVSFWGVLFLMR